MARTKSSKKIYKKQKKSARSAESKTISFLIGVVTVAIIALAVFGIAQGRNYKTVLGEKTQTFQQYSK